MFILLRYLFCSDVHIFIYVLCSYFEKVKSSKMYVFPIYRYCDIAPCFLSLPFHSALITNDLLNDLLWLGLIYWKMFKFVVFRSKKWLFESKTHFLTILFLPISG